MYLYKMQLSQARKKKKIATYVERERERDEFSVFAAMLFDLI